MHVAVSWGHIGLGRKQCSAECPLSLAIAAHVNPSWQVYVGSCFVNFVSMGKNRSVELPDTAKLFVANYNKDKVLVNPYTYTVSHSHLFPSIFDIEIPEECRA